MGGLNIDEIRRVFCGRPGTLRSDTVSALCDEVERLNAKLADRDIECGTQYELLAEKNADNAVLKMALEMMYTNTACPAEQAPDYFIQRAREEMEK